MTTLTLAQLKRVLRARVKAAPSLRQFAAAAGLWHANIVHVLEGQRGPGPQLLAALGYRKVTKVRYERITKVRDERLK